MVKIKEEPVEVEMVYRTAESDSEDDGNYYGVGSIRGEPVWCTDEMDVKPKIEPIEIDPNRQPVVSLDSDFVRVNSRPKWIELVKATFRRPSMERACQLCKKVIEFASASELIEHYDQLHRKNVLSYSCTLCKFSAKKKQEIADHWSEKHRGRKQVYIEVKKSNDRCNVWIGDDELVHSFFVNEQKSTDAKQSQGNDTAIVKGVNKNRRILTQKSKDTYVECDVCLKKLRKKSMKNHKLIHNNEGPQFECNICQKKFLFKLKLSRHMVTHIDKSKREKFGCKICSKQFLNSQDLKRHDRLHSGDPFKCDICGKVFNHIIALKTHILCTHVKAKPFKCGVCSTAFARSETLKRHEFNVHLKGKISDDDPRIKYQWKYKMVECDICFKKMIKSNLKTHKAVHSHERPFKCDVCTYSCRIKGNLDKHKATHNNKQMFECTVCPLKFRIKSSLTTHEELHRKDSQFKCQFCHVKYSQKRLLYLHYRTVHFNLLREQDRLNGGLSDFFQNVRTYECYKCKYSSYKMKCLEDHMEACKIGSKFMKCPKCIVKFDSKGYMRRHMTKMHLTKGGRKQSEETKDSTTNDAFFTKHKTQIFRSNNVIN